jgi:hypothetical protein
VNASIAVSTLWDNKLMNKDGGSMFSVGNKNNNSHSSASYLAEAKKNLAKRKTSMAELHEI